MRPGTPARGYHKGPSVNNRWDAAFKPINRGEEGELLCKRQVRQRGAEVEGLSGEKVGYVRVRATNDASMRTVFYESPMV